MTERELPEVFSSDDEGEALAASPAARKDIGPDQLSQLDREPAKEAAEAAKAARSAKKRRLQRDSDGPAFSSSRPRTGGGHLGDPVLGLGPLLGANPGIAGSDRPCHLTAPASEISPQDSSQPGSSLLVAAQDATEDEETMETMEDTVVEDEDDEAEVEEDEPTELTEEKEEEDLSGEPKASPNADTTILFVKGEDFPANNIVKFLVGFTNKGTEDFIVESLDASFRYPQDYQFFIQNFTALPLNTVVPPQRQATFEYSFIPAEPMGGRPFGLVINLNYKDQNGNFFQDAVFNQTVTIIEKEDGLDGETIFMYMFLAGLGLLVIVGLHQLLESRKRKRPAQKVEMGTSNQNDVDMSWIPQETLNQIMQSRRDKASPRRLPRKRAQKRSVGSDE
ncbi:PREDICTED: translocon-associated protein subunit alpha [Gekko japonicus]|uniref:Translocon-associated protein subunit alpha n=1 Tax=Gekko japonicus TaxID=146911 RepID=A0ABM1JNI9_GEKJA|nr:PREDICTED: translocon-associated protein subunit alpha [Gekko japonicus]